MLIFKNVGGANKWHRLHDNSFEVEMSNFSWLQIRDFARPENNVFRIFRL